MNPTGIISDVEPLKWGNKKQIHYISVFQLKKKFI